MHVSIWPRKMTESFTCSTFWGGLLMWCFRGQAGCGGGKERSPLLNVKLFPTPTHITYIYVYESHLRDKDICSLAFSDAESIYRVMSCRVFHICILISKSKWVGGKTFLGGHIPQTIIWRHHLHLIRTVSPFSRTKSQKMLQLLEVESFTMYSMVPLSNNGIGHWRLPTFNIANKGFWDFVHTRYVAKNA